MPPASAPILVIGRRGQIARALARSGGASVVALGRPDLDLCDPASLRHAIETRRPRLVVNAAAYTAVDAAETDAAAAFALNRDGAAHVAEASARAGLPLLHISTDHVFSGEKGAPYGESDATGPVNLYGRSKREGEEAVLARNARAAILRIAWIYGPDGGNFISAMIRLAGERDVVRVVTDERGSPTSAGDGARAILAAAHAILQDPAEERRFGLFHMANEGGASRFEFAEAIFAELARRGRRVPRLEPTVAAALALPARRPADSRLDSTRFAARFGHALPPWRDALRRCLDEVT